MTTPQDRPPDSRIVWRLPRALKSRYVKAAQRAGLPLIKWIRRACDQHADNPPDTPGPVKRP